MLYFFVFDETTHCPLFRNRHDRDRAHRIGQTHDSVQIIYMVCKDESVSIDMTLWRLLGRKINILGQVVDGKKVSR
jgi:hypothetical protein